MKEDDLKLVNATNLYRHTTLLHMDCRRYGKLAVFVNPLLPYQALTKVCESTCQYITVRVLGSNLTAMYISPKASGLKDINTK